MLAVSCLFLSAPLLAQETKSGDCYEQWKGLDADRNGIIDKGENGGATQGETRDAFLAGCLKGAKVVEPPGKPSSTADVKDDFPKDLGKGDLTKGKNPFSEGDARKRLEALGFKEVLDLKLDTNGIWRGTAVASGERKPVGLDAQGDVVSE